MTNKCVNLIIIQSVGVVPQNGGGRTTHENQKGDWTTIFPLAKRYLELKKKKKKENEFSLKLGKTESIWKCPFDW